MKKENRKYIGLLIFILLSLFIVKILLLQISTSPIEKLIKNIEKSEDIIIYETMTSGNINDEQVSVVKDYFINGKWEEVEYFTIPFYDYTQVDFKHKKTYNIMLIDPDNKGFDLFNEEKLLIEYVIKNRRTLYEVTRKN